MAGLCGFAGGLLGLWLGANAYYLRTHGAVCQNYNSDTAGSQGVTVVLEKAQICKKLFERIVRTGGGALARVDSPGPTVMLKGPLVILHASAERPAAMGLAVLGGMVGSYVFTKIYCWIRPDQDDSKRNLCQKLTTMAVGLISGLACGYFIWQKCQPKDLPKIVAIFFLDPQLVATKSFQRVLSFIPPVRSQ
jgi:hypothetical protein